MLRILLTRSIWKRHPIAAARRSRDVEGAQKRPRVQSKRSFQRIEGQVRQLTQFWTSGERKLASFYKNRKVCVEKQRDAILRILGQKVGNLRTLYCIWSEKSNIFWGHRQRFPVWHRHQHELRCHHPLFSMAPSFRDDIATVASLMEIHPTLITGATAVCYGFKVLYTAISTDLKPIPCIFGQKSGGLYALQ